MLRNSRTHAAFEANMNRRLTIAIAIHALVAALAFPAWADPARARYDYRVTWNGIPAANAIVTVTDDVATALSQLEADVRTNRVIDMLYNFRASLWGAVETKDWQPRGFAFHRHIGRRQESTRIEVGSDGALTGHYLRAGRSEEVKRIDEAGVIDPIAALLRLRHALPTEAKVTHHELFTGETRYRVEIEYVGEETIHLPAGEFAAIKVIPRVLRVGKKDDRIQEVTAWVTRDAPHTILRVRSDVFIGSVYADLTGISRKGYEEKGAD